MRSLVSSFLFMGLFAATASAVPSSAAAADQDPLQVVVSLNDQMLRVYQGGVEITSSNISSGKAGHATPTGVFSVLQKNRHHRSNIYSNAPMPFMQRLTWSGIALHASNSVPNYPASHGCVRLPHGFARELFKMKTNGMHVVIEDDPSKPQFIEHSLLFQPKKTWSTSPELDPWVNEVIEEDNKHLSKPDHRYPARIFITRRTGNDDLFEVQRLLNKLGKNAGKVDGLMGPATWGAIRDFQVDTGLEADGKIDNKLINRLYAAAGEIRPANGQLMIRKHHRTIFKTEVTIADPEQPLGSHLLTVSGFDADKDKTEWMALSLMDRVQAKIHIRTDKAIDTSTDRFDTSHALDRIGMSALDRELVSRHLSPGSSITISDNGKSIETGAKGTDFIVLSKPEPGLSELAANTTE